ncbi:hypothetical protein GJ633_11860 [Halorubrum sp. CBA1125]|uniref:hypothetical protein n=1 Tax=Halorubrum sp. CBA1125 TaxID=2668072 RepID=UPI0012E8559D|nr:hypothetical protein [Halorubrum sp. CBA1125]MUW15267.1 hypothetical protein [Halorubrum sp. CBA1125]
MVPFDPLALEYLAGGLLVTVIGALVKFGGWTWLLAGYSESSSSIPDDVVRDVAGNTILRIGVAVTLVGAVASVTELPASVGLLVGAAIVVAVLRLIYRLHTWSPSQTT